MLWKVGLIVQATRTTNYIKAASRADALRRKSINLPLADRNAVEATKSKNRRAYDPLTNEGADWIVNSPPAETKRRARVLVGHAGHSVRDSSLHVHPIARPDGDGGRDPPPC